MTDKAVARPGPARIRRRTVPLKHDVARWDGASHDEEVPLALVQGVHAAVGEALTQHHAAD